MPLPGYTKDQLHAPVACTTSLDQTSTTCYTALSMASHASMYTYTCTRLVENSLHKVLCRAGDREGDWIKHGVVSGEAHCIHTYKSGLTVLNYTVYVKYKTLTPYMMFACISEYHFKEWGLDMLTLLSQSVCNLCTINYRSRVHFKGTTYSGKHLLLSTAH